MTGKNYDIAVIGGGPAGMMASGTAAANGADVILIEKNRITGKKLLITGKGRCNITNSVEDNAHFISAFGKNGRFLYPSINSFDVSRTLQFFRDIGLETIVERGSRVFPSSGRAADVQRALVEWIKKSGVEIKTGVPVKSLSINGDTIDKLEMQDGIIKAASYIICTGGLSYPLTGSTGDGYRWAEKLGHTVVDPAPSLTDIKLGEPWAKLLDGLHLKNINAEILKNGKKIDEKFGEAFFTGDGVDGPVILDLSDTVRKNRSSELKIRIDLKPALDRKKLDARILREIKENSKSNISELLRKLLPEKLVPVIRELSGIEPGKKSAEVSRDERKKIIQNLKSLEMKVTGTGGFERAIITGGGISINQIDPKTLRSRLITNLFFAGEVIDINGVTGGYNLQACWSTGYLAGISAIPQRA